MTGRAWLPMAGSVLLLVVIAIVMYGGYLALLFFQQRSMLFPGAGMAWTWDRRDLPPRAESVALRASFGHVEGVLLPAPDSGRRTAAAALYFHGNAEFVEQNIEPLQRLAARGLHVLAVEYPGYAGTDGSPSRASLTEAARVAFDWLAARPDVDAGRIVAIGRSIGSGPAAEVAAERPVAALVLLSGFSSLAEFAAGFGAPALLVRDRFDNHAAVRRFDGPLLLMHGRSDRIIPFAHGQRLQRASPKSRMIALRCGHNDCPYFEARMLDDLETFLRQSGVLQPPQDAAPVPAAQGPAGG